MFEITLTLSRSPSYFHDIVLFAVVAALVFHNSVVVEVLTLVMEPPGPVQVVIHDLPSGGISEILKGVSSGSSLDFIYLT